MSEILDEKEAFLAVIFACMSADNHISGQELKEMNYILSQKKMYAGADILKIYNKIQSLYQFIGYNSFKLIELAADKISPEMKLTVYAHSINIFLADKNFHANEKQLATYLQKILGIDDPTATKINEVIEILNVG